MSILSPWFYFLLLFCIPIYYYLSQKKQISFLLFLSLAFYVYGFRPDNIVFALYILFIYSLLTISKKFYKTNLFTLYRVFVIVLALLPLLVSKYGYLLHIRLNFSPLGVSFITFMVVGFIIDHLKGLSEKTKLDMTHFLFFSFFFPHVTSGPIARKKTIDDQIKNKKSLNPDTFYDSLRLILLGIFQKFVIANRIDIYVTQVFSSPKSYFGFPLLFAVYLFSFQIYFDFLAYSNIAVGIAKLFGYDLGINFNHPYLATSIGNFWKRWHISLSSWLRDYIYIGLGGNRKGVIRTVLNVMITFAVSGLWHGSTALFLLWGLLNGALINMENVFAQTVRSIRLNRITARIIHFFKIVATFTLISLLWLCFKAKDITNIKFLLSSIFNKGYYLHSVQVILSDKDLLMNLELSVFLIIISMTLEIYREYFHKGEVHIHNFPINVIIYTLYILLFLFLGVFGNQNFYYVRF